jgi:DNA ligase (NAD+)
MLPVIMGSQDKVIAGQGSLERWTKKQTASFVVSEKLDGLSALYVYTPQKRSLYLRGDGVKGVDVSRIISAVKVPAAGLGSAIVRGELVMPSASVPAGSIGRSLINGWVHRAVDAETVPAELAAVRFVAYQVLEPAGMSRSQQFTWLGSRGFEVPWWAAVAAAATAANEKELLATFMERKAASAYPLDGLVLATDTVPVALGGGEARNPPDSVAFKASLDEQKAETTVVGVVWTASRQGMLIPRIQIEAVEIGGATIQWLSGHNAALIASEGIGPGARIIVRRSGDVIPALDEVLEKVDAALPPADTWTWDATKVHAMAAAATGGGGAAAEATAPALLHALQTLGVEGIGPGLVAKLCEAGFDTMIKLWKAEPAALAAAIGAGRGPALLASLKARRATASMSQLLVASNRLPRGVGERKMRVLFDLDANPRAWAAAAAAAAVPGWSADSLAELFKALPKAIMWVEGSFPGAQVQTPETPFTQIQEAPVASKFVVFTGVRDKELEGLLAAKGWAIQDAVSGKTSCLVVASPIKESAKTKKATQLGVKIMTISEFRNSI